MEEPTDMNVTEMNGSTKPSTDWIVAEEDANILGGNALGEENENDICQDEEEGNGYSDNESGEDDIEQDIQQDAVTENSVGPDVLTSTAADGGVHPIRRARLE